MNLSEFDRLFKDILAGGDDTGKFEALIDEYFNLLNKMESKFFQKLLDIAEKKEVSSNDINEMLNLSDEKSNATRQSKNIVREMVKRLKERQQEEQQKQSFAYPAHEAMFNIILMFAGNPASIPKAILNKSEEERTEEEKKRLQAFEDSLLQIETVYDVNTFEAQKVYSAIVCENEMVEAKAEIPNKLFSDDPEFRQDSLAYYIRKYHGPEGFRHLLGILVALDESGHTGEFEFDINKHLDRLGFRRQKGSHNIRRKKEAVAIMRILLNLVYTVKRQDKHQTVVNFQKLFNLVSGKIVRKNNAGKEELTGKMIIRAENYWYQDALNPVNGTAQYSRMLKGIAQENHRDHEITIYLSSLLGILWRMSLKERPLKVETILKYLNVELTPYHKKRRLNKLQAEFDYMTSKGYLGYWNHNGEEQKIADCKMPRKVLITLSPPSWMLKALEAIQEGRNKFKALPPPNEQGKKTTAMTQEEFNAIFEKSGLSVRKFAEKLGVSSGLIGQVKTGKKSISKKLANEIKAVFL